MRHCQVKFFTTVITVAIALLCVAVAQAETILIDMPGYNTVAEYGTARPAPSPDSMGRYWNAATDNGFTVGYAVTDAVDSSGVVTTVDVNVTNGFSGEYGGFLTSGLSSSAITDWDAAVTEDFWFLSPSNTIAQIRVEGLAANGLYDLTFYGSRGTGSVQVMDMTIGTTTQSYDGRGVAGEGLTTFSSVAANGSGEILVDFAIAAGSDYGYLGAIQIDSVVPEPVAAVLLCFGAAGLLLLPRRR